MVPLAGDFSNALAPACGGLVRPFRERRCGTVSWRYTLRILRQPAAGWFVHAGRRGRSTTVSWRFLKRPGASLRWVGASMQGERLWYR